MPEVMTLAELPPDVAKQMMKRIRVRLRPPLPPELTWESDAEHPGDGPATESEDIEFTGRGQGERITPVDGQPDTRLVCPVFDETAPPLEVSAPFDLPVDGPTERVTARDAGEYKLGCWFGEEKLGQ